MPAEALTKGPAPTRRSAPSAQKTAPAARSIPRPQHDDWASAAPESQENWASEPQSSVVVPRARPALPGTQSEEFEYLFHQEKIEPAVATAPKTAGWDEGLERLSIVTLCPTEESWERLRAWIETYSAQESRRPWISPKAELPATTSATPAPAAPSVSAPPPSQSAAKPFDLKSALTRGDFPPLSRDQQLAALESADDASEAKEVPEKKAPMKPEAGTAAAKTRAPTADGAAPTPQLSRRSPAPIETRNAPAAAAPPATAAAAAAPATRTAPYVRAASAVLSAALLAGAVGVFVASLMTGWRAPALPHL